MKSVFVVFVITVLFLVGMTKFTNDTNYNEALRYAELSQYFNQIENGETGNNVFLDTVELEVSFSGAVKSSETFVVAYGTFLSQAIDEMGGLTSDADERCINYNYIILENSNFYIPSGIDEEKVSINEADKEELVTLVSIGGVTASRIIEYRETYGEFRCLEDLMNVKGIGSQTFNKVKDYIIL